MNQFDPRNIKGLATKAAVDGKNTGQLLRMITEMAVERSGYLSACANLSPWSKEAFKVCMNKAAEFWAKARDIQIEILRRCGEPAENFTDELVDAHKANVIASQQQKYRNEYGKISIKGAPILVPVEYPKITFNGDVLAEPPQSAVSAVSGVDGK